MKPPTPKVDIISRPESKARDLAAFTRDAIANRAKNKGIRAMYAASLQFCGARIRSVGRRESRIRLQSAIGANHNPARFQSDSRMSLFLAVFVGDGASQSVFCPSIASVVSILREKRPVYRPNSPGFRSKSLARKMAKMPSKPGFQGSNLSDGTQEKSHPLSVGSAVFLGEFAARRRPNWAMARGVG